MKASIYLSQANQPFTSQDLSELQKACIQKNRASSITGYLWFTKSQFLQYIEGDSIAVDKLMGKITQDSRHNIISCCSKVIPKAKFAGWDMNYIDTTKTLNMGPENLLSSQLLMLKASILENVDTSRSIWHLADILAHYSELLTCPDVLSKQHFNP